MSVSTKVPQDEGTEEEIMERVDEWIKKAGVKARRLPMGQGFTSGWGFDDMPDATIIFSISDTWIQVKAMIASPVTDDIPLNSKLYSAILQSNFSMAGISFSIDPVINGIFVQREILTKTASYDNFLGALSVVLLGIEFFHKVLLPKIGEVRESESDKDTLGGLYV